MSIERQKLFCSIKENSSRLILEADNACADFAEIQLFLLDNPPFIETSVDCGAGLALSFRKINDNWAIAIGKAKTDNDHIVKNVWVPFQNRSAVDRIRAYPKLYTLLRHIKAAQEKEIRMLEDARPSVEGDDYVD